MKAVSIALLAALLPTLSIIVLLVCLSLYLFKRTLPSATQSSPELPIEEPPVPGWTRKQIGPMTVWEDPANEPVFFLGKQIKRDRDLFPIGDDAMMCLLPLHEVYSLLVDPQVSGGYSDSQIDEISKQVAAIGYDSLPVEAFTRNLRHRSVIPYLMQNLIYDVLLRRTSLHCDPTMSLLPIGAQEQKDLSACFRALSGIDCKDF